MSNAVMPLAHYKETCDAIREKTGSTDTIKSREMPDKINDVFRAGQLGIVSSAEALKGSASGSSVTMRDISPVEHDVKCTLSGEGIDLSQVKVQRLGKNLFDKNNANIVNGWFSVDGLINGADIAKSVYIPCLPNTTYTVSKIISARFYIGFSPTIPKAFGPIENVKGYGNLSVGTSTSPSNAMYLVVWCYNSNYDTNISFEQILDSLQIEVGTTATEYEPYIEPVEYSVNADGTVSGIKSLYPTTTLMSDTVGAIITAEYIKDIDKTFNSLTTAIALTGGE